jgi:flagellar hook assembly protein FlgD
MEGGDAKTDIYDIQGRLIRELLARDSQGGDKKAVWDATDNSGRSVSSGIYFARVRTPQLQISRKILYLR